MQPPEETLTQVVTLSLRAVTLSAANNSFPMEITVEGLDDLNTSARCGVSAHPLFWFFVFVFSFYLGVRQNGLINLLATSPCIQFSIRAEELHGLNGRK